MQLDEETIKAAALAVADKQLARFDQIHKVNGQVREGLRLLIAASYFDGCIYGLRRLADDRST